MTYGEVVHLIKEDTKTHDKSSLSEIYSGDGKAEVDELTFDKLKKISEDIGEDPILADDLYNSDSEALKILAVLIDVPSSYNKDELYQRTEDINQSECAEKFCEKIIAHSPYAVHLIDEWAALKNSPAKKAFAYYILGELAKIKNKISVDFFANYINIIREDIYNEPVEVKRAMNKALISMTSRDKKVQKLVKHTLQKIKEQEKIFN